MKATVFLGGGRITGALLAGLRLAGYDQPIVVHDRHARKLQQLKRQYGVAVEPDLHRAVESAHLLIIAVRPDVYKRQDLSRFHSNRCLRLYCAHQCEVSGCARSL